MSRHPIDIIASIPAETWLAAAAGVVLFGCIAANLYALQGII